VIDLVILDSVNAEPDPKATKKFRLQFRTEGLEFDQQCTSHPYELRQTMGRQFGVGRFGVPGTCRRVSARHPADHGEPVLLFEGVAGPQTTWTVAGLYIAAQQRLVVLASAGLA
jgi:hypothetical protein